MKMIEMFGRQLVIKNQPHSSFVGTSALLHVKPHTDRPQVNQFRHANLLLRVTASCCAWSYADIRGESITSTLRIVQLYYVNSLLSCYTLGRQHVCVCVCPHVFVCTWLQAGLLYAHLHFILSFWICHKSTCRISCVCAALHASMCACELCVWL